MGQMEVWIIPVVAFLATILLGNIIRRVFFQQLNRWSKNSKTQLDDIIIAGISKPSVIWFIMLGLYFALTVSHVPENAAVIIQKVLFILGIISVTLAVANVLGQMVKTYAAQIDTTLPMTSLTQNITRVIIFGIGILMLLNSLGISITPILASLGIGGLAVALALQDTLSNLFSGFHITISKQIRLGDYIKLESGEEGYVIDINWRTTKIKAIPNHVILVPNAKLNQAIVVNYHMPDKEIVVPIQLGVHYNSDLDKVEAVTIDVAKDIMKTVLGGVPEFDPVVRYHTFADSSVNFVIGLRVKEFSDQGLVRHEFLKALHKRFSREGIVIPYPVRAINTDQEKAFLQKNLN